MSEMTWRTEKEKQHLIRTAQMCGYCFKRPDVVQGDEIYPHRQDLYHKWFRLCRDCDAYVGTHARTLSPLGRLANAELRQAKMKAHEVFDKRWRGKGRGARPRAYRWLADKMGIKKTICHIGMFDLEQCKEVVRLCNEESLYQ